MEQHQINIGYASGREIFKLVDTYGLPLEICVLELRDRNAFFDVEGFIEAARKAGWKDKRIYNMLKYSGNKTPDGMLEKMI